ncbi:hypothetical protein BDFB_001491 [Asbolus verrucosus]|uniref:Uncharacterized protein n=1 Tax=Asbolus verrucosus TaxID=1661398 RepID=A0A482VXP0_ASBVE|nr:hypothetical protein BDFB_001491 [Asbolus verrucosus]
MKTYIVQKISDCVKVLTVDKLSNNGTYDSFKIGKLFEEFWPKDVLLRRFNFPSHAPNKQLNFQIPSNHPTKT